jgi:hypothetical protein
MIHDDVELAVTRERVAKLERLLVGMRRTARPAEWPALSSGYRLEIERMPGEILDYLVEGPAPGARHRQLLRPGAEPDHLQRAHRRLQRPQPSEVRLSRHRGVRHPAARDHHRRHLRGAGAHSLRRLIRCKVNIVNISKINSEVRGVRASLRACGELRRQALAVRVDSARRDRGERHARGAGGAVRELKEIRPTSFDRRPEST